MELSNTCKACGRWSSCASPKLKGDLHPDTDVLFVGDIPTEEEDLKRASFTSEASHFLKTFASFLAINEKKATVSYTYAVKCHIPMKERNHEASMKRWVASCRNYLFEDIKQCNPKVIVALGSNALQSVWPEGPKSIAQARVAPQKVGNTWVMAAYHPVNHITGRKDLRQDYFSLGRILGKILTDTYEVEAPVIIAAEEIDLPMIAAQISQATHVFFDVETDTLSYKHRPDIKTFYMPGRSMICIGIGTSSKEPVWVIKTDLFLRIKDLLKGKTLVAHNILYDNSVLDYLCKMPWVWDNPLEDTFLMHVSMDQGYTGNSLDDLSMKYLSVPSWKKEAYDEISSARLFIDAPTFADIPWDTLVAYNGRDVFYTAKLFELFQGFPIPDSYKDRYMRLVPFLGRLQVRGIPVDAKRIRAVKEAYEKKIDMLLESLNKAPEVRKIAEAAGSDRFNVRSPKQKTELMQLLSIDPGYSESKKYYKTDKKTMGEISLHNSLIRRINVITEMQNMLSKFINPLSYYIADDGRVHTFYTMGRAESTFSLGGDPTGGVITGRLSARDPAMHNIKKDPILRSCFVAPPGYVFLEFDYSAAEVRGLAWLSNCANLLQWFNDDIDPYLKVISLLDQVPYEEVLAVYQGDGPAKKALKARRQVTKNGFLGWQYGSGLDKFAVTIGASMEDASRVYDLFTQLFPEVRTYQEALITRASQGLPIITKWGVQRRFVLDTPHDVNALKNFEPQEVMSTMTAHAGDVIERAIPAPDLYIVNLVHDAHVNLVKEDKVKELVPKIATLMTNPPNLPFELGVKLVVEAKIGKNLGKMIDYSLDKD